jgi:hypothetical protein
MFLGPEKVQLVVLTIAYLHNFLRRSSDSAAVYTPPGMFDYEENGQMIEGRWRAMGNENMISYFL